MKIIVDAFGGDNAPLEIIKGCVDAISEYGFKIILVGSEKTLKKTFDENNISLKNIEIYNADDIITMEEPGTEIMKSKKDSSMAQGLKLLADGVGDAFLSAGNSGALVVGATFLVKRIKGIKRCAFAPIIPKDKGFFMLIDSGANVDCRPEMLKQFGIMGSIYMNKVMKIDNPKVGLANIGIEEHKGCELQKDAFLMLKESPINFVGNIEARDIPLEGADVIVCDGFTGNIILKMFEGVVMALMKKIKGVFNYNLKTKLAGAMIMPEMKLLKKSIDYSEHGGAPILGIRKPVFKAHGNSDAKTIKNALYLVSKYVQENVAEEISTAILEIGSE